MNKNIYTAPQVQTITWATEAVLQSPSPAAVTPENIGTNTTPSEGVVID